MITTNKDIFYEIITSDSSNDIEENDNTSAYEILAVTAYPIGIAHTYMASDALKKAAKELKCTHKSRDKWI